MKYLIAAVATVLAAGVSAGIAGAAPSGPTTASETVNALQSQGFHVILNKLGAADLDHCVVTGVRSGQTFARTDSGAPGAGGSIVATITAKTVYVDLRCP